MGGPVRENYIYRFVFQYCTRNTAILRLRRHEFKWNGRGGKKKRKGSRSCILQPRTNGIPDLRSRILLDKPDPYRTSAICHTAPEQTSFRSSINHLFLFFFFFFFIARSLLLFSTRARVCILGSSTRVDYFPRRETGASSSTEILPEAATLDPVAGRADLAKEDPFDQSRARSEPSPLSPCVSRRVERCSTSSFRPLAHRVRLRGRLGSASCRNASTRCTCGSRLVVDSASIEPRIHPILRNASPFVLFLSFFYIPIFAQMDTMEGSFALSFI